jgi:hypothetical protein
MDPANEREHVRRQLVDACQQFAADAGTELGLETEEQRTRLVELCIRMFNAGVRAGASQALAQMVEQGIDVNVNLDPEPLS